MSSAKQFVTMDGNEACAYAAYAFSEVAAIYPITPSSPMAGKTDEWAAKGRKNVFGQTVTLVEMQSEAGAIGAIHGSLEAGALSTSFTSSQGLMLMIPVMHRISGERLPGVLHVASRTVGTHALSIFGDHSDVMNCRQTGFAMLSSANAQEVMDLAPVAHLAAIEGLIPFLHFFDGFRTSHELSKVEPIDYADLKPLVDMKALEAFRAHALNPEHPMLRATVQNPDIFFQVREANNAFYDALPGIVQSCMDKIASVTGRRYHLFDYYGAPDAEYVVVAMGSVSGTIRETVDWLNARGGKTGFLQVHLYRPFSAKHFLAALPASVKRIAVLDRCKEMGAAGDPLYLDVRSVLAEAKHPAALSVYGGRYGLSSKDTDPAQIEAVFRNLAAEKPMNSFTIGIVDDVTRRSLPVEAPLYPDDEHIVCCKFWGLGSDGTVGANKNTVNIINAHTPKYAQAYFEYDAKKSFGVTKSHLRFGDKPIRSSYYVKAADFIGCHNATYISKYDVAGELKPNGTLLLNCPWTPAELDEKLPAHVKRTLAERHAKLYLIDAVAIAERLGLGSHINMVLQAAFFRLANVIPVDDAVAFMKAAAKKTYFAKGDDVVNRNLAAIDEGVKSLVEALVPESWLNAADPAPAARPGLPAVVTNLLEPINAQKGDDLPVSAFKGYEDGVIDMGLTAYEKRDIAVHVPVWDPAKCIQCNKCAFACPHAVVRPYLLTEAEAAAAPAPLRTEPAKGGKPGYVFTLQISAADCTGCGVCASVCPAKEKALTMTPNAETDHDLANWNYLLSLPAKSDVFNPYTVKGSQFRRPLLEFSAACAGCGETPYAKLLTQLFGDRVYWANATGCSQAWGSPMPGIPYTVNQRGFGPAWTNSLFENNAEFALGMLLSSKKQREMQVIRVKALLEKSVPESVKNALQAWLDTFDDFDASRTATDALCAALESARAELASDKEISELADAILLHRDQLAKKTFWMYGGDGWAYDIGFGGLDHVIASGENINALIVDTEVYSNTGGQSSKATQIGAVAQFASSGKRSPKKDLGRIFMTYGNVYVASVAMGADPNQLMKALQEAEAFPGPSVVIAYAPCMTHGLKCGMCNVQQEMKAAVDAGYWFLYRYNPSKEKPFTLDSPAPTKDYRSFLKGEVRFAALERTFPENAASLFETGSRLAAKKYAEYKKLEDNQ
ncbi:MAG: pyruvate:ferredoxin (flavodoxin) oxidoreductase [Lentisphaeria bacterium]|nr:pyruvate:ferredoxin (flavodoxin) oxidoreductase [Lentisphaeria bacterium]